MQQSMAGIRSLQEALYEPISGIVALTSIKKYAASIRGSGMAIIGIVTGILGDLMGIILGLMVLFKVGQ